MGGNVGKKCDILIMRARKKCVAVTKKHIAVPTILLNILIINRAEIT